MASLRDYLWKNRNRFTNTEFARRLSIHRMTLCKIANGYQMPSMSLAKAIELETNGEVKWTELMEYCYEMVHKKDE